MPGALDGRERRRERGVVLGREADDHVAREVELAGERLEPAQVRVDGVAAPHRAQDAVVAGLERDVQVARDGRRLAQRGDERVVDVVDLDRAEPQPLEPGRRAGLADEPRQVVAGGAVAEAAEVDAGEHDLAVALRDAAPDLARARRRRCGCARRRARAGSRRSCTRTSSRPGSSRTRARGRGARRPGRSRSRRRRRRRTRRSPRCACATTTTFVGQPGERRRRRGSRRSRSRRRGACVRAARAAALRLFATASFVTQHVLITATSAPPVALSAWPSREQRLAHLVRVDVRDLAAEKVDA